MNKALFITLMLVALSAVAVQSKKVEAAGQECGLCTFVANYVDNLVQTNKTITEIEQELDNVCFYVSAGLQKVCTTLINNYLEKFISQETPTVICTQIGFCPAEEKKMIKSDVPCAICTYIVSTAESYLASNATESEIIAALENDCNSIGNALSEMCKSLVAEYAPQIIQQLVNKQTPSQICGELNICTSEQSKKFAALVTVDDGFGCPVFTNRCSRGIKSDSESNSTTTSSSSSTSSNPTSSNPTATSSNPSGTATGSGISGTGSGSGSAISGSGSSSGEFFVSNGFNPKSTKKVRVQ
ncbi:hypothetical protein PPL_02209 [Heterostelium album PN500]|uniref:Saposin B-type domain-containing protein n=1 Tax=Heterostelium pallidum (strain ATCC 26659 / Pp 5 / PN500) TaxID=670386 RepID=D3B1N5_HETP5|nr:hypothetical protein PPL_02209 [Heterostelium album PN500]EFA85209.1 hypothetical protein PPL_02209 [Heterostelium album PN500]|eukprot:XP_020437318.1 hypothetical protein PPL_02209 [Heterostelium album PN500]